MKNILLLVFIIISLNGITQPTAGLVAYWPMNGNFTDAGSSGINGLNTGATPTTNSSGIQNSAISFGNTGSDVVHYGTHPINATLNFGTNQDFSVDFSMFITEPLTHPSGFYDNNLNYGGYGIWAWNLGGFLQVNFNFKNGNIGTTNGAINTDTWYHICCVRSSGIIKIYINGVLNASKPEGTVSPVYSFAARFGTMFANSLSPNQYNGLNGKLDEMRIYNRALSDAEIVQLYNLSILPTVTSFMPVTATSGTTVTITGTNFTEATAVSFGGTPAISFTVVNTTTITAVIGAGSSGTVSVTTSAGTATLAGFTFIPTPTITSFTPTSGPVGTLVTITGTNLTSPTAFSIGGVSAIAVSNSGTTLVGMVMPGAVTGAVSVTNTGGTITTATNFTVTPTPYPSTQQGSKLVGTGAFGAAYQGVSVAVAADGNTAIVGGYSDNSNVGAAWVYTRSGAVWTQQGGKLVGTGALGNARQGSAVSISADGNTAIVGGYQDNSAVGAAWIYTRSGGVWTQQGAKLVGTGSLTTTQQGFSVSISSDGNTAIVGGFGDNFGAGAAWIFARSGGVWAQQGAKMVGTGAVGNANQGRCVFISSDGNTAIVGGYYDNSFAGAAWVYTRSGGLWTQQGTKLVGAGGVGNSLQGSSVSLSSDGNTAIIGGQQDNAALGAAWIFTRSGGVWAQQGAKLVGTGIVANANQGSSVSLSSDGNTAIVGGYSDNSYVGAAWVYTRSGGVWTQQGTKLVGTGGVGTSYQGWSFALSSDGTTAIAGGIFDNTQTGAAWVFTNCAAPVISIPSPATQVLAQYATPAAATVTSTGTSLSYQWYSSGSTNNFGGANLGSADGAQTNTYTPPPTDYGTRYYYCVVTGSCGADTSETAVVTVSKNTWTGNVSTQWDITGNWLLNTVPLGYEDIIIPTGAARYPVLTGFTSAGGVELQSGATITIGDNTLNLGGTQGQGTITGSPLSRLLVGPVNSSFDMLYFTPGAQVLKDLVVGINTVNLLSPLTITGGTTTSAAGTVTIVPGASLNTFGNLTLQSSQYGTASIAANTSGSSYINGEVTVERYIPNNGFRSWRLLSVPTYGTGQTIRQAWQEGTVNTLPLQNNLANYGTQITGTGVLATAQTAGFDNVAASAALLNWNGSGWSGLNSTNNAIETDKGYFLYIRGERSKGITGTTTNSSATTLRSKGLVYQGDQPAINFNSNNFYLVGNVYPSAINFQLLERTGGVSNVFYTWDSKKLNGSSLGAYQTFSATNNFNCILSGGSYTLGQPNTTIESGQAFFVQTNASPGTIALKESAKIISNNGNLGFRPAARPATVESRLYSASDKNMLDAAVVVFDAAYSKEINAEDAPKLGNPGANFSIETKGKILSVEGTAPVTDNDIIQFRIWNLQQQTYTLEMVVTNVHAEGISAVLEDAYLKTSTVVQMNTSTVVNFAVDSNAGSSAASRFRIVFRKTINLPAAVNEYVIAPNPIEDGVINLQFKNKASGKYLVNISSNAGQSIKSQFITHGGGTNNYLVTLPLTLAHGSYQVEIIAPGKTKTFKKFLVNKQ